MSDTKAPREYWLNIDEDTGTPFSGLTYIYKKPELRWANATKMVHVIEKAWVDQLIKDHENDWKRIQDAERKCEALEAKLMIAVEALEVIASNGEGRGMGWTPAQHARQALDTYEGKE